jgi:hypothetical protein
MLPNSTFPTITNSDGKVVSVRDIGEQHVLEDFRGRFIPSAQDYLSEMEYQPWMQNGEGVPPSFKKIDDGKKKMVKDFFVDGSKEPAVIPWPTTKEPPFRFPGELKD